MPAAAHGADCSFDLAIVIQRRLEEEAVEVNSERGQVAILFVAQICDRKALDRLEVIHIAARGDRVPARSIVVCAR